MPVFNTHGRDTQLKCRDGQRCEVIRPLTSKEADLDETGPMYRVRFKDGFETDAFEDELDGIAASQNVDYVTGKE